MTPTGPGPRSTNTFEVPRENWLDFQTVREELDNLMESVCNKIEREWPAGKGNDNSAAIVWGQVRLAFTMFRAIRFLTAEKDDGYRKPEYVFAAAPIARSIADALANLVYLFESLSDRTVAYIRGSWKEDYEHWQRDCERFAGRPERVAYLDFIKGQLIEAAAHAGLSGPNLFDPRFVKSIRYWPIPGQMMRDRDHDPKRREFIKFIDEWFYREFSAQSHISGPGLWGRVKFLLGNPNRRTAEDLKVIGRYRSEALMGSMALLLCIAAEVELELRLGLADRIIQLWTRINATLPDLKEIYDRWYAERLPALMNK